MTTAVSTYSYLTHTVRVIEKDSQPWFLGPDVCSVLGITNTGNAYARLDSDELDSIHFSDGKRGYPNKRIISESGLYKLLTRAHPNRPEVAAFRDWVTREVLPAIRKDGLYVAREERVRTRDVRLHALAATTYWE